MNRTFTMSNTSAPRALPLQDGYLAEIKRQGVPVTIYLVNGFQLRGVVKGFDAFTILLEYERKTHLIYKHAVSTVSPQNAFTSNGEPEGTGEPQV
ncbi:MAG: RNA chaperone Hfq [Candidatus Eremiobacteraeota bacterium]|nr:RNA chaperone Hfq [Candidatus Eremiobacteraeota bacterium]